MPALRLTPGAARHQRAQHRQSPDAAGERNLDQQHGGHPAQSAAGDRLFRRGPDGVEAMTGRANMGSPAPFKGVIDTDDDRAVRDEGANQGVQQGACELQPRPAIPVEHAVKGSEAGVVGQAEGAQQVGDGAGTNRQHRSDCERRSRGAGAPREGIQIGPQPSDEGLGKGDRGMCHGAPVVWSDVTSQQPFADGIATPAHDRTSVPKCAKSNDQIVREVGTR